MQLPVKSNLSVLILVLTVVLFFQQCKKAPQTTEERIENLLSQMTIDEKIGQMHQLTGLGLNDDMKSKIKNGTVGSIINEVDVNIINELQRIAVEESRLGIPLIFGRDVIHGYKTIFPIPLGQAASWNPEVAKIGARIAAQEASSAGIRWTFAPMVDVTRDPRWGRIAESCGEDPYLTSVMGAAMVKGFQGDKLSDAGSIAACAKHFAGYGAAEAGKDYNTTWIPEMQLRDVFLPPFKAAVDAGVASFMCSFNDINGVPSSANKHLNVDILRNEWIFDGMLVSDWGSIEQIEDHGAAESLKESAEKAINAGVDMDMMGFAYNYHLKELVSSGKVSEDLVDNAVRNILRIKFRLGLFENPYTKVQKDAFYKPEALEAAKNAAIESAVLLKNNALLPIDKKFKTIAVVGPLADAALEQFGTWSFDAEPAHAVTPLAAIKEMYGNEYKIIAEPGLTFSRDSNVLNVKKAVAAAQRADVVLVFAGEEAILSGEAHCRADISLPGLQNQLIAELKKTGKPIVTVIMAGRPLTIEKQISESDAVLFAFHGGTMAGPALADLIFGKAVPSGKLPVTFPRMVGQIPVYYAHKNTGRPGTNFVTIDKIPIGVFQTSLGNTSFHLDAGDKPMYPFGFGLSYTTFEYSKVKLSSKMMEAKTKITAECTITNTGKMEAKEVVQLYVRDVSASLARPIRELKGFEKLTLKAGESKNVKFEISADQIGFWNLENKYVTEPGEFRVWISKDSQSGEPVSFKLN